MNKLKVGERGVYKHCWELEEEDLEHVWLTGL